MSKYDLSHYYSLPSSCKLALTYGNTLLLQATSCLSCCVLVRTPHTMFCVQGNVLPLFLVLDRHPHISSLLLCAGSYSSHHRMRTGQRLPLFHVLDRHPHILLLARVLGFLVPHRAGSHRVFCLSFRQISLHLLLVVLGRHLHALSCLGNVLPLLLCAGL